LDLDRPFVDDIVAHDSGSAGLRTASTLCADDNEAIKAISPAEAARRYPAKLQATITYVDVARGSLFVQDKTGGIYVFLQKSHAMRPCAWVCWLSSRL